MEGEIVFEGTTKEGKDFLIRYPKKDDLQALLTYANTLSHEQTFIRLQGEEITTKEESQFLNEHLKRIKKRKGVYLIVTSDNKIIGGSEISMKDKTENHEGVFGLAIAKDYRGQGLGKKLMELVLQEAEYQIPQLRIVTLELFANNPLAKKLYEKFGFKEFGRLPEGIAYKGGFVDSIYMFKKIR